MNSTEAAALWSRIEDELLKRGLVREGRELRENRASLVRLVGDGEVTLKPGPEGVRAVPLDFDNITAKELSTIPPPMLHLASEVAAVGPTPPSDAKITQMLDRYLDQATGVRGYDPDDEVPYR